MPARTSRPSRATLDEVVGRIRTELPALRDRYRIRSLSVFGSYVRGAESKRSDLDLLIEFTTPPTLFEFVRLERHLSEIAGTPVDLVMKSALKPRIGARIISEAIPI